MYYSNYSKMRDDAGITDAEVARRSGVAKATLTEWKKGTYTPKTDKLRRIAVALGATIDDLIEGER